MSDAAAEPTYQAPREPTDESGAPLGTDMANDRPRPHDPTDESGAPLLDDRTTPAP